MMPLRKKRRVQVIAIAAVSLALSTGLIGYAMRDGISFFRSPSQVLAEPPAPRERFRIGGLVEAGSVVRGQGETVSFRVTDGAVTIPVTYTGVLPDLFAECQATVAMGVMTGDTFEATEVLAKHDETYTPREVQGIADMEQLQAQGGCESVDAARGAAGGS